MDIYPFHRGCNEEVTSREREDDDAGDVTTSGVLQANTRNEH